MTQNKVGLGESIFYGIWRKKINKTGLSCAKLRSSLVELSFISPIITFKHIFNVYFYFESC